MSSLAPIISDLALILMCAGIMTLIFKRLKQPLVLGYIVAGFLASPHLSCTPSVADTESIHTWSEIGVIFLLFALGLDFSFKKLMKVGGSAIIAACTIILFMIGVGIFVGWSFGWKDMDCIFLGGMLAMSSTTIIYKAFDDMGLRQQRFAGLVMSILILEDILAIVLMVMLTTLAVSKKFEGTEMVFSILKLVFFLILWFVVGIYLIPVALKRLRKWMTNETLLVVVLALCFGMVVLAAQVGFSPAFGAFIMGSILAETVEAEHVAKLVAPVKDLFGAIFFVSVGMMVDPVMIAEYIGPIIVIVLAILIGQTVFGTSGVLLSGQPLKIAMQCGFSLTQIGEFAFIIASLGVSLRVTSNFLYPIVVAVSVITTFLTPYMIRLAVPAYNLVDSRMPVRWRNLLEHYVTGSQTTVNHENNWKKLLFAIVRIVVIYLVLCIAVMALSFNLLVPFLKHALPDPWGRLLAAVLTIVAISPFLRAIIMKKNHSVEFQALWRDNRFNRAPLLSTILFRMIICILLVFYIIEQLLQASTTLVIAVAFVLVCLMMFSRFLKKQSILLERRFVLNLHSKEMQEQFKGEKTPEYAGHLLSRDLHLSDFQVPVDSEWAGQTLNELDLGRKYDVHVASIIRGNNRINIPGGSSRIFPGDTLQVIGTDDQLSHFSDCLEQQTVQMDDEELEHREMKLCQLVVDKDSPFCGKNIREGGFRNVYRCLVVGVERSNDGTLMSPDVSVPLNEGDVVWIVGERDDVRRLLER